MNHTDTCSVCLKEIPEGELLLGVPRMAFCQPCLIATNEAVKGKVEVNDRRKDWREWVQYHRTEEGKVRSVLLPLTPAEWCKCCMREGDFYRGPCCGNMGRAQDILNSIFRDGGWAESDELYEWYQLLRSHDGYCPKDLPDPSEKAVEDPIARIVAVCGEIDKEEAWDFSRLDKPRPTDLEDIDQAISVLSGGIWRMYVERILCSGRSDEETFQHKLATSLNLAESIPALRTLFIKLKERDPGPIDAWAIYLDGAVAKTRGGLAIYASATRCREVIEMWREGGLEPEKTTEIKPIRVTVEEGLTVREES